MLSWPLIIKSAVSRWGPGVCLPLYLAFRLPVSSEDDAFVALHYVLVLTSSLFIPLFSFSASKNADLSHSQPAPAASQPSSSSICTMKKEWEREYLLYACIHPLFSVEPTLSLSPFDFIFLLCSYQRSLFARYQVTSVVRLHGHKTRRAFVLIRWAFGSLTLSSNGMYCIVMCTCTSQIMVMFGRHASMQTDW